MRKHWVGRSEPLALTRQCELTGGVRSTVYAPKIVALPDEPELILLKLIDAEYTRHPFLPQGQAARTAAASSGCTCKA